MSHNLSLVLMAGFALIFELAVLFLMLPLLGNSGMTRPNYQGVNIPVSAGITFPMTIILAYLVWQLMGNRIEGLLAIYLAAATFVSLLGFIDDLLGNRDTLGFKGHFRSLFQGRLTTGGLKAVGGGVIALYVALAVSSSLRDIVVNVLVIALFTNLINLLDLRPGRAIKGFIILLVVVLWLAPTDFSVFIPLIMAVLAYFPFDLRARAMMGDSGSNVLGFTLGMMCAVGMGFEYKLVTLALLILIHLFTEKYSLTEIIAKVAFLRYIDNLGRSGK